MPDFSTKNEGTWFHFDDDDHANGGVCLRELSTSEQSRIEKITTKTKRKIVAGSMQMIPEVDEKMRMRMTWDYCIVEWAEVMLDGVVVECTTENKVQLMESLDFAKFVLAALSEIVETNETLEADQSKNSVTSSSGKKTNQPADLA